MVALDERDAFGPEAGGIEPRSSADLRISLLDRFRLENDGPFIIVPERSQRLLAFLALKGRMIRRPVVAGTLWPVATEEHASSSLRSALARLHGELGPQLRPPPRKSGCRTRSASISGTRGLSLVGFWRRRDHHRRAEPARRRSRLSRHTYTPAAGQTRVDLEGEFPDMPGMSETDELGMIDGFLTMVFDEDTTTLRTWAPSSDAR